MQNNLISTPCLPYLMGIWWIFMCDYGGLHYLFTTVALQPSVAAFSHFQSVLSSCFCGCKDCQKWHDAHEGICFCHANGDSVSS